MAIKGARPPVRRKELHTHTLPSHTHSRHTQGLLNPTRKYNPTPNRKPHTANRTMLFSGGTPPRAVYSAALPRGMPMPLAPKSPRPRMRSPSVKTE